MKPSQPAKGEFEKLNTEGEKSVRRCPSRKIFLSNVSASNLTREGSGAKEFYA